MKEARNIKHTTSSCKLEGDERKNQFFRFARKRLYRDTTQPSLLLDCHYYCWQRRLWPADLGGNKVLQRLSLLFYRGQRKFI